MRMSPVISRLFISGIAIFGCSSSTDQQSPDYSQCKSLTGEPLTPSCDGLACAKDDHARHFLGLFLDVLAKHGVSAQHKVLSASMSGGYVDIEYVVSIDWFQGANSWL